MLQTKISGKYGLKTIRHFSNEKGTGTEMCPAIVSGIVTGNTPFLLVQFGMPGMPIVKPVALGLACWA